MKIVKSLKIVISTFIYIFFTPITLIERKKNVEIAFMKVKKKKKKKVKLEKYLYEKL
jgi:hypothetical protein